MNIAGFDVFDTILTRAVGSPEAVFSLLGRRLAASGLITMSAEVFALTRARADARSRANAGGREVKLAEIYAQLAHALQLTDEQRDAAMRAELGLEEELLQPVPEVVTRVAGARSRGDGIAFLSDTYLPAPFVQAQLRRHKLMREGDACYVSCEEGATKWSGALFGRVLREKGVAPAEFQFCGNQRLADLYAPRRIGIRAEHLEQGNLNRYERLLEDWRASTGSLSSVFAGASRLARLRVDAASPDAAVIRDVAAGVIAPALTGFAMWLLRRYQESGTQRLYFLSRDGHLLRTVTTGLARRLGMRIDTRYLFSSRRAWLPACITQIEREQLEWSFENSRFLSVQSFLHRLGIMPSDVLDSLRDLSLAKEHWNRNLGKKERDSLRSAVLDDPRIGERILHRASEARDVLIAYLRREGLFDDTSWALVDLGWHASIQTGLHRLLTSHEGRSRLASEATREPAGFYFGLRGDHAGGSEFALRAEGYFLDERRHVGFVQNDLPQLGAIMEIFCAPGYGPLESLARRPEGIEPVLRPFNLTPSQKRLLGLVRLTTSRFIEALHVDPEVVDLGADVRPIIHDLIRMFWYEPSEDEARGWGKFPIEEWLGMSMTSTLAQPYRWGDLWRVFRSGRMELPAGCAWFLGCFRQTPPPIRLGMRGAKKLAAVRARLLGKPRPSSRRRSSKP